MIRMTPAKRRILKAIAAHNDRGQTVGHFDPNFSQSDRTIMTRLMWDKLVEYGNIDFRAGYVVTEEGRKYVQESK